MSKPDDIQTDDALSQQAKRLFDDSVESLDGATLSRLNRSRQAALVELESRGRWRRWTMWAPVAGVSAAAVMAILLVLPTTTTELIEAPSSDFEILMGEESIEMLEELEFYSWLATVDLEAEVG